MLKLTAEGPRPDPPLSTAGGSPRRRGTVVLGRSLKHLIETITRLAERQIGLKSLTENIDTTTSGGKLIFHVFGALAEFERDIIKERTQAGLLAARVRGKIGGRPRALTAQEIAIAQALYADPTKSIKDICHTLRISKRTLYRYIEPGKRGGVAGNKTE